jgi:hypothetical protein
MADTQSTSLSSHPIYEPSPRRPKRALSELLNDPLDHDPSPPFKQACRRSDAFVLGWLRSQQSRSCGAVLNTPVASKPRSNSAPVMLLPTPPPSVSVRFSAASSTSSTTSAPKTSDARYRIDNLSTNGIRLRRTKDDLSLGLQSTLQQRFQERSSPPPDLPDPSSLEMGTPETEVEAYIRNHVLPEPHGSVRRSEKLLMEKYTVPNEPFSIHRVCAPKPDITLGYDRCATFSQSQQIELGNIPNMRANSDDLLYPFFLVEVKGSGAQSSGSLWAATNQCLGGASACTKMIDSLNSQVRSCTGSDTFEVNDVSFSVATSGTEARLFMTWKQADGFETQKIQDYMLQRQHELLLLRQHTRNIVDWGGGERLKHIKIALSSIMKANRLVASRTARARTPPHDVQGTRKKRNLASSARQQPSSPPAWKYDETHKRWYYIGSDNELVWY